jgi:hypothetical protein
MTAIMKEAEAGGIVGVAPTTGQAQREFSQRYSAGELEEMSSRELLDGYAD